MTVGAKVDRKHYDNDAETSPITFLYHKTVMGEVSASSSSWNIQKWLATPDLVGVAGATMAEAAGGVKR